MKDAFFAKFPLCLPLPVDCSKPNEIARLKGKHIFNIANCCQSVSLNSVYINL